MGEGVRDPRPLLPLTPAVLHILLALADGERHGYGIMREVEWRTGGETRVGPGTLLDRLRIDYRKSGEMGFMLVSPEDKGRFVRDLGGSVAGLEVRGEGVVCKVGSRR